MDKKLYVFWFCEKYDLGLSIFDENPIRVKLIDFISGHHNFEPKSVTYTNGVLEIIPSEEHHKASYRLSFDEKENTLNGTRLTNGNMEEVTFTRAGHSPMDWEYEYVQIYVPKSEKCRIALLRECAEYENRPGKSCKSDYFLDEELPEILSKYDYWNYVDGINKNDDRLAFSLLDFVCDHFFHNGSVALGNERSLESLISFCEKNEMCANCRGLSIILATLLRMNGIKARHITCLPYEEPFMDCHVVVDCLLPSGKRVMLDPTTRLYYTDKKGEYVSLRMLREMLIKGETPIPNKNTTYRGEPHDASDNIEYMTKNTLRFSRGTEYKNGIDDQNQIELVPAAYPCDLLSEDHKEALVFNEDDFWEM